MADIDNNNMTALFQVASHHVIGEEAFTGSDVSGYRAT